MKSLPAPHRCLLTCLAGLWLGWLSGCEQSADSHNAHQLPVAPAPPFHDAAEETGLVFQHDNGMSGALYMPEMMGAGVAVFDYDNDGRLDVFAVQGGALSPTAQTDGNPSASHRLFHNELETNPAGQPVLKFRDTTDAAGLTPGGYGMGAAAADFDGDGWCDLFLPYLGRNRLLRNSGHGTFEDITESAGVGVDGWHTSASWVDYDRDGRLDLFVCRYLEWTFQNHRTCTNAAGAPDYCGPQSYVPARSRLYKNLGAGRFEDVSLASHIASLPGAALGVVTGDFDGDGWPDLLVANDGMPNHLWINQKDGTFREEGLTRGCALNAGGVAQANMGVIAADFFNTGRDDLFITHLVGEHATFYRNLGGGQFVDVTTSLGLDAPTRALTGFGTCAIDYDNDGHLDIFAVNGAVKIVESQVRAGIEPPLQQRSLLLHHAAGPAPRFNEITAGEALAQQQIGRGLAVADLDNDGAADLLISNNHGPLRLLLNDVGRKEHWIGLRLVAGTTDHRVDALGAIATVEIDGQQPLRRRCAADGSYLSSSDPRVLFGLGPADRVSRVRVRWPDGLTETWTGLEINRYHELVRGSGAALE
ncbi:MAG: CRTAC1 family protein [Planctomycetes bacterium]|nr:CRTAC1 family protein [Planctomycetota bacterium]